MAERLALAEVEARLTGAPKRMPILAGRYEVVELLGRGGMGEVFRAIDRELGREVALKLARPGATDVERVAAEARTLAQLADPNIVAIYDVFAEHDGIVIVMELVRGCSLRCWLAQQRRPWREIVAVMIAAGQGLAAAHRAGVVHRDIKPDNIMIADDAGVRLVDFGLAHGSEARTLSERSSPDDTGHVLIEGTLAYLAPELADGRPADARSDQLAFCLTLFEALYGLRAQRNVPCAAWPFPRPWQLVRRPAGSDVPTRVHRAIERGLASDPHARHESMAARLSVLTASLRPASSRRPIAIACAALAGAAMLVATSSRPSAATPSPAPTAAVVEVDAAVDRSALDRIDALVDAGEMHEALALAEREQARMQHSGDERGAIDAERRIGELRNELGEHHTAQAALHDAYFDARALGDDERSIASALDLSVMFAQVLARPDDAAEWLRHARSLSPDRARFLSAEAGLLLARGRAGEAVERYRSALPLAADSAWAHHDLGVALHQAGRDDEAVAEHVQALGLLGTRHDGDHPAIAFALTSLGNALGRGEDALAVHRRALEIRERALGDDHPDTAASLVNVGGLLADLGHPEDARVNLRRALAVQERSLGPDHPDLAATLNNLGTVAADPDEASRVYGRAQAIQEAALDPDDPELATVLGNLAIAYADLGRNDRARELLQRALTLREHTFGREHAQTAYPLHNLGVIALDDGDAEAALPWLERALRIRSDGRDPVLLATTQLELARALAMVKRDPTRANLLASAARSQLASSGRDDLIAQADALLR